MIGVKIIRKSKENNIASNGGIITGTAAPNLYNLITNKLDKATFDDLFEKVALSGGGYAIRAKYAFYTNEWMSCLGANPDAGTVALGATTLGGLNNVTELADSVTAADKVLIRRAGEAQWTLANLSDIVGLDTTALATYLSNNHYAKTSDIPSLAEYATRTWVQQQGYLTEHQSLAAYLTKTEASQLYQPIGDYATNSALNSAVSTLNTAIGQKLDAATFDDLFVKEADGKGGYRIKARYALYSNQYLSCLGNNPDAGTVALGATTLGGLNNVVAAADEASAAAKVLVREAGSASWTLKSLSDIVGLDTAALAAYLSNNGYATQQWVRLQGYLTEHQSLADYATKTWVQAQGYLTAITKAQVEAVLTGDITTHTHSQYLTSALAAQTYQPKGDYALTSALNSAVSTLNTAIGQKLDKATFDDLFVKESDGNGGYRIRAKYAIYSNQYISCLGNNPGAGTTTGGGVDLDAVAEYLTQQGYATQQWVQAQGYLKAADLSAYALADNAYLKNQQNRKSNAHTVASLTAVANSSDSWINNYSLSLVNNNNALNFYVGGVENERQALIQSGHSSNGYAQVLGTLHLNKLGGAVYINNSFALNAANVGSYAVTLDTEQTISGKKTFTAAETAVNRRLYVNGAFDAFDNYPHYMWHVAGTRWTKAVMDTNGYIHFVDGGASGFTSYKSIKALAFVVSGGTASQFLKADGSVDSNTYLTAHQSLDHIRVLDTRNAETTTLMSRQLTAHFKGNDKIGLADGGLYTGLLHLQSWDDASGGSAHDIAFTVNGNMWLRTGAIGSAWGAWRKVLDTNNYASVLDSRYFRAAGAIPTAYVDLTTYTPGATGYANYQSGAYQVQRGGHSELLVNLAINGGSTSALQFYTSYGDDAALKYRKTIDANRVSGPWRTIVTDLNIGSYALTPSNYTSTLDGRYVNASGDTMTGALSFGDSKCGIYRSGDVLALKVGDGNDKLVITNDTVRRSTLTPTVYLGASDIRWANVYANTINVSSNALVSNLNADLLDGCHASDFTGNRYASWTDGETVVSWAKRIAGSNPAIYNESYWGWASAKTLTLGSYSIDSQRYAAIDYRRGNLNNVWQQKAIMFLPTHSDASMIYIAQMTVSGTAGAASLNAVRRYATYDTILASNVASATKLQTARNLWGNSFDGTGDISGNINLTGQHAKIGCNISDQSNECPWYGLRLSIMEGWHVMLSGYYGTSLRSAGGMLSLAQSGYVGIGTTTPAYKLHVVGDIMADGWVRTTGAHGWYNQTYGGGWYMDNASWIKSWNKPVYIGFTSLEGAYSFGVGLRCYHASHTSVEVQGGSYTMGLGCHSDGRWYWWRGTSSGKGYVMQYDGATWAFNGVIKTSTGMYSDGYMSCLEKNDGSDARLKTILRDVTLPIDVILGAPAVRFTWNANAGAVMAGKVAVGTIAQYWLEHLTEVVGTMPTGYYGVNYGTLDWIAIHSVAKYAKTEIELLKEENQRLKERVAALERRVVA